VSTVPPSRSESAREAQARERAWLRRRRLHHLMRPIGLAIMAIVVATTIDGSPHPALHGDGLGVSVALVVYVASLVLWIRDTDMRQQFPVQLMLTGLVGAAGVALAALQPHGASELAASASVWMAVTRLPMRPALALGASVTAGLALADALSGTDSETVLASILLCVLLGITAHSMRTSRESQEQTELLLAELEDAHDAQAQAAAATERGRIAGELHDVLAHSLSGASIQLQGARLLAEQQQSHPRLREAIDRAGELVRDGLDDARRAVGALRGDQLPTVEQLAGLIERFRADTAVAVTLSVEGDARPLPPEASLALYRGAQEALTNVARYAPGAATSVVLRYDADRTTLSVEDRPHVNGATAEISPQPPAGGGGHGLSGMRERVERAGGHMEAGPSGAGWRVSLEVPA
jgi:signal transduction histidine kinase